MTMDGWKSVIDEFVSIITEKQSDNRHSNGATLKINGVEYTNVHLSIRQQVVPLGVSFISTAIHTRPHITLEAMYLGEPKQDLLGDAFIEIYLSNANVMYSGNFIVTNYDTNSFYASNCVTTIEAETSKLTKQVI
jgi:hypothetical protein